MQPVSQQYAAVRKQFEKICLPLSIEDYGLQAMPDTSPAKWHLAHTTWFFETFLLKPFVPGYTPLNAQYEVMFNSYYNGIGEQYPRPKRHLLSRPTVEEVYHYREYVDEHMQALLADTGHGQREDIIARTVLGINHEQQHQELFFTDLKYCLYQNPLLPAYTFAPNITQANTASETEWLEHEGGLVSIGINNQVMNEQHFTFDNESPEHQVFLSPFEIASHLVTNADYLAFIQDGGYQDSNLWLSDGWAEARQQDWQHPLYWWQEDEQWFHFTLYGKQPLALDQPVCHISGYEADAFARWAGARLPSEAEWEVMAKTQPAEGQFLDAELLFPGKSDKQYAQQWFGYAWQWTSSAYQPYPGFQAAAGAIGEYNGKFMCNQQVLRGGSCVTPKNHFRTTYRNFFYPPDRWQFTGLRLAK